MALELWTGDTLPPSSAAGRHTTRTDDPAAADLINVVERSVCAFMTPSPAKLGYSECATAARETLKRQLWAVDSVSVRTEPLGSRNLDSVGSHHAARHPSLAASRENLKAQWYDLQIQRGAGSGKQAAAYGRDDSEKRALDFEAGAEAVERMLDSVRKSARRVDRATQALLQQTSTLGPARSDARRRPSACSDPKEHRNPGMRVAAKIAQRQRMLAEGGATADNEAPLQLPMQEVNVYRAGGRERVQMVDVPTLQSRCRSLTSGASAQSLLESEKRREQSRPFAAAARSTFMQPSSSAPALTAASAASSEGFATGACRHRGPDGIAGPS